MRICRRCVCAHRNLSCYAPKNLLNSHRTSCVCNKRVPWMLLGLSAATFAYSTIRSYWFYALWFLCLFPLSGKMRELKASHSCFFSCVFPLALSLSLFFFEKFSGFSMLSRCKYVVYKCNSMVKWWLLLNWHRRQPIDWFCCFCMFLLSAFFYSFNLSINIRTLLRNFRTKELRQRRKFW